MEGFPCQQDETVLAQVMLKYVARLSTHWLVYAAGGEVTHVKPAVLHASVQLPLMADFTQFSPLPPQSASGEVSEKGGGGEGDGGGGEGTGGGGDGTGGGGDGLGDGADGSGGGGEGTGGGGEGGHGAPPPQWQHQAAESNSSGSFPHLSCSVSSAIAWQS